MHLAIIVGTRPEIIRLSSTIKKSRKIFKTTLIHTGQNYDYTLNQIFFEELEIDKPDIFLECSRENLGATIGDIIAKSYDVLRKIKPNALLILGDTNSCLCAYSAKRLKIPIFHVEAGNRCYDPNLPEEINRKIIDHISDVNMCYMEQARYALLKENVKPHYTFVVGSPMREVLYEIKEKINKSTILDELEIKEKDYFVWSTHREENIDIPQNFKKVINSLNNLAKKYQKKVVFSVHPRTRKMIGDIQFDSNIIIHEPFGLIDYCKLQQNALCVLSDSGTLTEESSILRFSAILVRTSTEHPEGIDAGNILIGNIDWNILEHSLELALKNKEFNNVINYTDMNVSHKICNIILSYCEIVNKFIWMK